MNAASEADVVEALQRLRRPAPDSVLPGVLAASGLGHRYATVAGPLGPLYVAWSKDGVSAVAPAADDRHFEKLFSDRVGGVLIRADDVPARMARSIRRVLETGRLGALTVDLSGLTDFQREVLRATAAVPKGELRPYGWIAREIGRPGAARAVGSALNKNPVPVLIPCHRVGRSDGSIGEYAFGEEMKRSLLRSEGLDPEALEADAARGIRFVGSDTTHIYCLPTCRNAKRIMPAHRREFRGASGAQDDGYRPCKVCRPVVAA